MKKVLFTAITLITLANAPAQAGSQDFVLSNQAGGDITRLFISSSNSDEWGDDVLGEDVLPEGEETPISFEGDDTDCVWDFKIVFTDGEDETEFEGINLCEANKVTLIHGEDGDYAEIE